LQTLEKQGSDSGISRRYTYKEIPRIQRSGRENHMGRDRQSGKREIQRSRIQQWRTIKITIMKKSTWKEIIRIIVTVLTALLTALGAQSCTATMSVFWKNANSQQKSEQSATNKVDSVNTNINLKR
jgi:hypothetical protein